MVAGASLLGRLPTELARGSMAGWQTMIATLVAMATLVLAGLLGDLDWRYTFQLHLLALPVVIAALALPASAAAAPEARATPGEFWRRFPYGLTILGFFLGLVSFAATTYAPYLFHDIGLEKPSALSRALTASAFTTALFSVLFGVIRRRMSAKLVFVVPVLAAAAGAALAGVAPSFWPMISALLLFGAGMGPLLPNLYAILMGAPAADRGPIFGVVKGLYYGSAFVGAVVLEPVMRAGGPRAVVLTLAGLLVAVALAVVLLYGRSAWTRPQEGLAPTRP
jgi:MFS family permease